MPDIAADDKLSEKEKSHVMKLYDFIDSHQGLFTGKQITPEQETEVNTALQFVLGVSDVECAQVYSLFAFCYAEVPSYGFASYGIMVTVGRAAGTRTRAAMALATTEVMRRSPLSLAA